MSPRGEYLGYKVFRTADGYFADPFHAKDLDGIMTLIEIAHWGRPAGTKRGWHV